MLYDQLADVQSDLEWALFELRSHPSRNIRSEALKEADAALERLNAILAIIAQATQRNTLNRYAAAYARYGGH
jgi:hypothetical protein